MGFKTQLELLLDKSVALRNLFPLVEWVLLFKLFHPCGAVAQLGERLVRNEEASGSIPLSSTKYIKYLEPLAKFPSSDEDVVSRGILML